MARISVAAVGVQVHRVCEVLTELTIYAMVVFSPWAFGTTQAWSIWTMNALAFGLGLLLLGKLGARRLSRSCSGGLRIDGLASTTAGLMLLFLAYGLVSALNARATFRNDTLAFEYFRCIAWLPHSLDAAGSWFAFWRNLGLVCVFWAVADWLSGKTTAELAAERRQKKSPEQAQELSVMPARLQRLIWALSVNGSLLATEGIVQRLLQSPKLLFLVLPRMNQAAGLQFGPFAYRANAAEYFNLVWPVCLGLWCVLEMRGQSKTRHALLVCVALMAFCPLISNSRGGALVDATMLLVAFLAICARRAMCVRSFTAGPGERAPRGGTRPTGEILAHCRPGAHTGRFLPHSWAGGPNPLALGVVILLTLGAGVTVGWPTLSARMSQFENGLSLRSRLYAAAKPMARDYPWFGTGPGTFETVSQLYPRPDIFWPAQLHNDWLESRITLGWVGCGLVGVTLLLIAARGFIRGQIQVPGVFPFFIYLALGGCILHAAFDFPFQVHSIVFLADLLLAVVFVLSARARPSP